MNLRISRYLKSTTTKTRPIIFKISFGLKEVDRLTDSANYRALRFNSLIKIPLIEWDKERNLPKGKKERSEIERIEQVIINTFNHLLNQGSEITIQSFKHELDCILGRSEKKETGLIRICDYIEQVMEVDPKRKKDNQAQYKYLKKHIRAYEESAGFEVTTKNLDREIFIAFMNTIRSKMNTTNAVWKIEKNFKAVLNEIRRKYEDIQVFNPVEKLSISERTSAVTEDKVFLDFHQINTILKYKPENERLRNTKLILATLLFTGCRFSDVFKIKPEFSYNQDGLNFRYARFIDQKTETDIIVPILKPLEDAIQENRGKLPYQISDQKFNDYVKELVQLAELDEETILTKTNAQGKKEYSKGKLFQFVSSHIGRRSFITNLINHVPITMLSKITGHTLTNKSVIFTYNKISLLDNTVLFVKELDRVTQSNPRDFPIQLV